MSDAWYYVDDERQLGPVSSEQLRRFLQSPRGRKNTPVWRTGLSDWRPAGELPELLPAFDGSPPPLPGRALPPLPPVSVERERIVPVGDPQIGAPENESFGRLVLSIGAVIGGTLFGALALATFGAMVVWPAAFIGITWFILSKLKVESAAIPMLSFVIGHAIWVTGGHIIVYAMSPATTRHYYLAIDLALVIGLVTWFLVRRSRSAAVGILVFQCIGLGTSIMFGGQAPVPGASSQLLTLLQVLHSSLRIIGIACCIYAIAKIGKRQSPASAAYP